MLLIALKKEGSHSQPKKSNFGGSLELHFLDLECDPSVLKQSEAKNLSKMAVFEHIWLFFRGFWLLVASKQQGHTPNQENRILGVLPDL